MVALERNENRPFRDEILRQVNREKIVLAGSNAEFTQPWSRNPRER